MKRKKLLSTIFTMMLTISLVGNNVLYTFAAPIGGSNGVGEYVTQTQENTVAETDEEDAVEQETDEESGKEEQNSEQKDSEDKGQDSEQKDREEKDSEQKDSEEKDSEQKDSEGKGQDSEQKDSEDKGQDSEQKDSEDKGQDSEQKDDEEKDSEQKDGEEKDRDADRKDTDSEKKDADEEDADSQQKESDEEEQDAEAEAEEEIFLPIMNSEGEELTPEKDGYIYYATLVGEDLSTSREIKGDMWLAGFEQDTKVYTGVAITQDVRIYHKNKKLVSGVDYKITYKNNLHARRIEDNNAPAMTLTLIGQYTGGRSYYYTIQQADINDVEMFDQGIATSYTGTYAEPVPTVTYLGKKLVNRTHFIVSYLSNTIGNAEGITKVDYKLEGRGDFKGVKYGGYYYICGANYNLSKATLVMTAKNLKYTGTPITVNELGITVKLKNKVLDPQYFDVELQNFDNAGIGTVIIRPSETGKSIYAGCLVKTYKITGGLVLKNSATVDEAKWKSEVTYSKTVAESENGFVQDIDQLLKASDGTILKEGIDFTVKYANNRKVGSAKVTFTGMGKYTGVITKNYKITPATEFTAIAPASVTYAVGGAIPEIEVKDAEGCLLKQNTDYTVKFTKNTQVGEATYKVTGKGNYAKTTVKEGTFKVIPATLETATQMTVTDKVYANKANNYKVVPVLTGVNGKKLVQNKDYDKNFVYQLVNGDGTLKEIADKEILPVGSRVQITVKGINNFEGTKSVVYKLYENTKDIKKLFIKIDAQIYTGEAIEPALADGKGSGSIHLYLSKADMNASTNEQNAADYVQIDSYANNIKSGKGTVVLSAHGEYGGTAKYQFVISKKSVVFVGVTSVKWSKNKLELKAGQTEALTAKVLPENADEYKVFYVSNNTQVATISDDGVVTAVSSGVTTLTVTAMGFNAKKVTDTCYVYVTDNGTLPETYITPQEYGAVAGDGKDDLEAFNKAIEAIYYNKSVNTLWVPAGVYDIDVSKAKKLTMKSGVHVRMDDNAVIKAMPNAESNYEMIWFWKVENASFTGGKIVGERQAHKGTNGEWGHCIAFFESKNITINHVDIGYGWGDGIYFGNYEAKNATLNNRNISIDQCNIHHNRRNNVGLTCGENIVITNCKMDYATGTDPQFGMDIETNEPINPVKGVYLENCTMSGNGKAAMGIITPAQNVKIVGSTFNGDFHNRACSGLSFKDCTINGDLYLIGFSAEMVNTKVTGSIIR